MALLRERETGGSLGEASQNNGDGLVKVSTGLDSRLSMTWITSKGRGRISANVKSHCVAFPGRVCSDLPRVYDETGRPGKIQSLEQETASLPNSDEKYRNFGENNQGRKHLSRPVIQSRSLPPQPEMYIPAALPAGQAAFDDRKAKNYRTGVNFDAYEGIPVEIHGKDVWTNGVESFEDLELDKIIRQNVIRAGYRRPTPIQKNAMPLISVGRDVMACAQTGSGKSAAYLLPIINKLMVNTTPSIGIQCLIVSPTRELAMQINREGNMYCNGTGVLMRLICGGVAIWYQKAALKRGAHMLIATPGRLIQFIDEGHVNLKHVKYFVLDEADRMFEMGFMDQIYRIVKSLPPKAARVNVMFSATFPTQIQKAAAEYLHDYVFVAVGIVGGASGNIEQLIYEVESVEKRRKLKEILADVGQNEKILVFCSRKANADSLATYLSSLEFAATSIHSDKAQSQRDLALREFVEGKCQVLVATDVAARGLDIPKVAMVINYDLPESIDEYVQRIGRTGRVGHIGKAISFFETGYDESLRQKLGRVLRDAGQLVPVWLEEAEANIDGVQTYRRRYGAVDFRRQQGNFVSNCVPIPVEADGEEW